MVELSCRPDLVAQVVARRESVSQVKTGAKLRGRVVLNKTEHGVCLVQVSQPRALAGMLGFAATKRHLNDLAGLEVDSGDQGRQVSLLVQEVTSRGEAVLVMKIEARKAEARLGKRARGLSQSEDVQTKRRKSSECEVAAPAEKSEMSEKSEKSEESEKSEKSKKKKTKKRRRKESEKTSEPAEEDPTIVSASKVKARTEDSRDPGWNLAATSITTPAWQTANIWSEDELDGEEEEEEEKKKKKKTSLSRQEDRVVGGEEGRGPNSQEEMERLVVASPDSSLVWLQYMALLVQSGELEAARALATRALQRINFRLEEERLNIFLAWLNLENTFGTEETLAGVLKEALQVCDQFKVYSQLALIYQQAGNFGQAEATFKLLAKKFNKEKEVWIKFGIFYYKNNKLNDGRFLLQRSLQSLDKKEHIEMSSKFAQIEFRYGEAERGKTMFETILANYPKRTDLWSVYADQLVKTGDLEAARALFKRMATLELQAKKMKFLFKKWLDFESGHGTEAGVSEVKQAAQKYLEGRGMGAKPTDSDQVVDPL